MNPVLIYVALISSAMTIMGWIALVLIIISNDNE